MSRESVLASVRRRGEHLARVDWRLKRDREIVLAAVTQCGTALQYADFELTRDRDIALAAVRQDGEALQHVTGALRRDRDIVKVAVEQTGVALRHADDVCKGNPDIVSAAVGQHWWALQYVVGRERRNPKLLLTAVQQWPDVDCPTELYDPRANQKQAVVMLSSDRIDVDTTTCTTVGALKRKLQQELGRPADRLQLTMHGQATPLKDDQEMPEPSMIEGLLEAALKAGLLKHVPDFALVVDR